MTAFALAAVAMVGLALAWVLPVLLRGPNARSVAGAAANLAVLKDQLAELERDLRDAAISSQQYDEAREDLQRRALEEGRAGMGDATPDVRAAASTRTAWALVVAIPVLAAALYLQFGSPAGISWQAADAEAPLTPQQIEAMVARLTARLEQMPDDGPGWALLARSHFVMQRFPESAAAYARAASLIKGDADLLADYADALAMSQGRRVDAQVMKIAEQALELDPMQGKALAMAGSGAFESKDYARALRYWERLRSRAPADSDFGRIIDANIAEARALAGGGQPGREEASGAGVRGTVSLSAALASQASPSDTVFVFARAASGPRQPLAIIKSQVRNLPLDFSLDDTNAMAPEIKLSNYPEVVVSARVSKSGQATPQSGDLQGASATVKPGASGVTVVIDAVVP